MNKRAAVRFEKVFPVILSTEEFGECNAMARNISAGGILIEIPEPLPLGTDVRVHFTIQDSQASIVARGEVKNHYFLNFNDAGGQRSLTGMAIRFTEFEAESEEVLGLGLTRMRILH
jgi:PilZ domain-containing protein